MSLKKKLIILYARQLVMISVATIISTFVASYVIENLLIKKALMQEAEHFWALYQKNQQQPVPNTNNLRGYLVKNISSNNDRIDSFIDPIHEGYRTLKPGFGRVSWQQVKSLYYVSDFPSSNPHFSNTTTSARLYLFFLEENVNNLILIFGVLPLSLLLLLFYASSWFVYVKARGMMSPLQKLAKRMSTHRFGEKQIKSIALEDLKPNADIEVLSLIEALEHFNQHLVEFVNRERAFTRDASHELRTPIAIIKGSLDIIDRIDNAEKTKLSKYLFKIRETADDMEQLISTLLLLANNSATLQSVEIFSLNTTVEDILEKMQQKYTSTTSRAVKASLKCDQPLYLKAPPIAANIIIENIIENAFKYTHSGSINVQIDTRSLIVRDTGEGMNEATLAQIFTPFFRSAETDTKGFGLGLPLVKRLCESMAWSITINSQLNEGSIVTIRFPEEQIKNDL